MGDFLEIRVYSNIIGAILTLMVYLLVSESSSVPSSTGTGLMVFLQLSEANGTQFKYFMALFYVDCVMFLPTRGSFVCVPSAVNSRVSPQCEGTSCCVLLRRKVSKYRIVAKTLCLVVCLKEGSDFRNS